VQTLANVPPSRRANAGRGQSNLAHSTLGWNNSTNDRLSTSDDDEQGHPTPAAAGAAAGALNEKSPRLASSGYQSKKSRKWLWLGIAAGALLAIALAVGLGVGWVYLHCIHSSANGSSSDLLSVRATKQLLQPLSMITPASPAQHPRLPRPQHPPQRLRLGRQVHLSHWTMDRALPTVTILAALGCGMRQTLST